MLMKAILAEVLAKRYKGIDIKINNGVRDFIVNIDEKKLTYNKFKNIDMDVEVYTLVRNCCSGKPFTILKKGSNEQDDKEIKELIESINLLIGSKLKEILV